jgi:Ca-activated chloride channel family protein
VAGLGAAPVITAQDARPTFHASIAGVSLNVVVKDDRGRPITDLIQKDFQILDQGQPVPITDFRAGEEPVSLALLVDTSGSMRMDERLQMARRAAMLVLRHFRPGDEAGLFTFDKRLHEIVPFTTDTSRVRAGLDRVEPFGSTSLHDAVAAAARTLAGRPSSRRAVVAVTDGIDNSSSLSADAASGVASSSDVPVYVLAVSDSDRRTGPAEVALEPVEGGGVARLDALTGRTGGASFSAETTAAAYLAGRHILTDLRAGYVLTFTPYDAPGWHPITVRVSRKDVRVRTRAGFWMGSPAAATVTLNHLASNVVPDVVPPSRRVPADSADERRYRSDSR